VAAQVTGLANVGGVAAAPTVTPTVAVAAAVLIRDADCQPVEVWERLARACDCGPNHPLPDEFDPAICKSAVGGLVSDKLPRGFPWEA